MFVIAAATMFCGLHNHQVAGTKVAMIIRSIRQKTYIPVYKDLWRDSFFFLTCFQKGVK